VPVFKQALSGRGLQDAHILLRTGLHAIEAKGAVEISYFFRLKQIQLASSLPVVAANAIVCGA